MYSQLPLPQDSEPSHPSGVWPVRPVPLSLLSVSGEAESPSGQSSDQQAQACPSDQRQQLVTGLVMFPCALCGRQYKYKDSLRRHLRLECGKDPQFQCSVCDYRAKQKSTLVSHMATKHSKVSFPADIVARQTWKI
ncbi:hypothetical protein J6590_014825 [Homalodisca vitripennis]|nr:hypothetical protein J6590_014825 [Homalodisca vitripennis]